MTQLFVGGLALCKTCRVCKLMAWITSLHYGGLLHQLEQEAVETWKAPS